jgi:hypothetical protein
VSTTKPTKPDLEPTPSRRWASLIPILILGGVGCILIGLRDFGRAPNALAPDAPPALTNGTATTEAATTNASSPVKTLAADQNEAATRAFLLYENLLRNGEVAAARVALQSIDAALPSKNQRDAFWLRMIPTHTRTALVLATFCPACTNGACPTCTGSGVCEICSGSRRCQQCEEHPVQTLRCTLCRCSPCAGTGRCTVCRGLKNQRCPNCAGGGGTAVPRNEPCESCGGDGVRDGLKRGSGNSKGIACVTCRGTGKRSISRFAACPACKGQGSIACDACQGTGTCVTCKGRGRAATCPNCIGKGIIHERCRHCGGNGGCTPCRSSGRCSTCSGRRLCARCNGAAIQRDLTLPARADWFSQPFGYVIMDSSRPAPAASSPLVGAHTIEAAAHTLKLQISERELLWVSDRVVTGQQAVAIMNGWVPQIPLP